MDLHEDLDESIKAVFKELSAVFPLKSKGSKLLYDYVNNHEPDSFFMLLVDLFRVILTYF